MSTMQRVSKKQPCPVCKKPDWCLIGKSSVICMRVLSPRQQSFKDGSVGYVHPLEGKMPHREFKPDRPIPHLNPVRKLELWADTIPNFEINDFANGLGVSPKSLQLLGCQRAPMHKTWAFPMRNGDNAIVGIRLRSEVGRKWAVTGSHQGLFLPQCDPSSTVYLVEGPTDTAAALTLGVFAIGRPSCNGGIYDVVTCCKRLGIKRAVIISDNDEDRKSPDGRRYNPGIDGSLALVEHLEVPRCVLTLPTKDIRGFVEEGGNKQTLECLLSECVWRTK